MENLLFNIEPRERKKETCGTCDFKIFIEYRSGKRFHYCRIPNTRRTQIGLIKVKCKTEACKFYKQKTT